MEWIQHGTVIRVDMDVRSRFVADILHEEGATMLRYQEAAIRKRTKEHSGRLLGDRSFSVTAGTGSSGTLTIKHTTYERYLDMRRLQRGSQTVRSNRKIHNRFVFGTYGHIAKRLLQELSDELAEATVK